MIPPLMPIPHSGEIAGLACAFLWAATSFLWASVGRSASAAAITAFKAVVGLGLLTAVVLATTGSPWPRGLSARAPGVLAASGVIGLALGDLCYFVALALLGPRRALLLLLLAPPLTALLGLPTLGEAIGPLGWTGIVLTMAGIAAVQLESTPGTAASGLLPRRLWTGLAAGALAGLAQAIQSLLVKSVLVEGAGLQQVVQVRLAAAAAILVAAGLVSGKTRSWVAPFAGGPRVLGLGLAATAMGTVVGLLLMTYSQGEIPVALSNTLTSTSPLFGLVLARVVEGERVTGRALAGTVVAVGGVALVFVG